MGGFLVILLFLLIICGYMMNWYESHFLAYGWMRSCFTILSRRYTKSGARFHHVCSLSFSESESAIVSPYIRFLPCISLKSIVCGLFILYNIHSLDKI